MFPMLKLDAFLRYEEGRGDNFYNYAKIERSRMRTMADLARTYAAPLRVEAYRQFPVKSARWNKTLNTLPVDPAPRATS